MDKQEYILLIQKQLSGEITSEEKAVLDKHIYLSEENQKIYSDMVKMWSDFEPPFNNEEFDTVEGWNDLTGKLNIKSETKSSSFSFNKWYGIAASILVLVSLSVYYFTSGNELHYINNFDEVLKVTLPDQSIVRLNKDSEIRLDWDKSSEIRSLDLVGEAFFNVAKNEKAPFIVNTKNSVVKVLGTKFNVNSTDVSTTLTVKSGKVSFRGRKDTKVRILVRNQQSVVEGTLSATEPIKINADQFISWIGGKYNFKSLRFEDVLKKLQQDYDFNYKVEDQKVLDKKITASFNQKSLSTIIETICTALGLKYNLSDGEYYFF